MAVPLDSLDFHQVFGYRLSARSNIKSLREKMQYVRPSSASSPTPPPVVVPTVSTTSNGNNSVCSGLGYTQWLSMTVFGSPVGADEKYLLSTAPTPNPSDTDALTRAKIKKKVDTGLTSALAVAASALGCNTANSNTVIDTTTSTGGSSGAFPGHTRSRLNQPEIPLLQ